MIPRGKKSESEHVFSKKKSSYLFCKEDWMVLAIILYTVYQSRLDIDIGKTFKFSLF